MAKLIPASRIAAIIAAAATAATLSAAGAASTAAASVVPASWRAQTCNETDTSGSALTTTPSPSNQTLSSSPFGVAATADGAYDFVSEGKTSGIAYVGVYQNTAGVPGSSPVETIATGSTVNFGNTITPDGKYLLTANSSGNGISVISVNGSSSTLDGTLTYTGSVPGGNQGAISVAAETDSSTSNTYAFLNIEGSGNASGPGFTAVFDLTTAINSGYTNSGYIGSIPMGIDATGLTMSPNGTTLYSAVQAPSGESLSGNCYPKPGKIVIVSTRTAETNPAGSVTNSVTAGYSPVRVIDDGTSLWVANRSSDTLEGFNASTLAEDANVTVGEQPVGLAWFMHGSDPQILVLDSARYSGETDPSLAVVDTTAAINRTGLALLGHVNEQVGSTNLLPAGSFPREAAVIPGSQTALVSLYSAKQLQTVQSLP